ncbi:MAG: VWA domain-containing protein [Acidobacteriota bacterium]|nr:VWA domain-containing protein [Acidobacteriota bacterium]MDE3265701.1 VWA domain-containing protein [Acidobacteriota bacterium]
MPERPARRALALALAAGMLLPAVVSAAAQEQRNETRKERRERRAALAAAEEALPLEFREFLSNVHFLISDAEREAFLEVSQDYQRRAWIERFWRIRDPYPDTPRNELRARWEERLLYVEREFEGPRSDRARMLLLNGEPSGRIRFQCTMVTWPIEIWFYSHSDRVGHEFFLLFYRRGNQQHYELWHPSDGIERLLDFGVSAQAAFGDIQSCRDGEVAAAAINWLTRSNGLEFATLISRLEAAPEAPSAEWTLTFEAYTTDVPLDAEPLEATLDVRFPARYQARTVVEALVEVDPASAQRDTLGGQSSYNFFLTGEVLRGEDLFENFRYKFDLPQGAGGDAAPGGGDGEPPILLSFERRLRPGDYRLVLKIEDLNGGRFARLEQPLEVPALEAHTARQLDPAVQKIIDRAEAVLTSDVPTVQLVEPAGELQTGLVRFDTLATGDIAEMRFWLDGGEVARKRRAPFSVELDLGSTPRVHVLRATAHDGDGSEIASDEISLNAGRNRFALRFSEPREGVRYDDEVHVEIDLQVPDGSLVERLELHLNDEPVATLYQEPWSQLVELPPGDAITYLRAAAYLVDGNSTDAVVYVNAPDYLEIVDIQYVELYATALHRSGRPYDELRADQVRILEDGAPQEILRFQRVTDLPVHVQVMLDVSASMVDRLGVAREAALDLFQTEITPRDRAALVTFNDHPYLASDFTNDTGALAGSLAGLKAERGTALYDAIVFGLYYLNGIKGQRALLLLSDGKDESSRFSFDQALEYAQRSGVAVYAIGLGKQSGPARRALSRLANQTGGRAFFIAEVAELAGVYGRILGELRSRYLITYQSTNTSGNRRFREIEADATVPGVSIRTLKGYYP